MPSTSAPRAPSSPVEVASGTGPSAGLAPGGGDQLRRTTGGAGGRVGLVGVVQLDDLDRLVEPGRLGGEPHHQHGADREVRGDQDAGALALREPAAQRSRAARRRTRWCRRRRGCRGETQNSRLSITTSGWVKSTTASTPASTSVCRSSSTSMRATSSRSRRLRLLDRVAHLAPDLAQRAQHAHLESHGRQASDGVRPIGASHEALAAGRRPRQRLSGPTWRASGGGCRARAARACTSVGR